MDAARAHQCAALASGEANEAMAEEMQTPSHDALLAWAARVAGGVVVAARQIAGGNRYESWAVDVRAANGDVLPLYLRYQPPRPPTAEPYTLEREAQIYRAIAEAAVRAPRLAGIHPSQCAILTERVPGRAEYRRLKDPEERRVVATEFVESLAKLHQLDTTGIDLDGLDGDADISTCVGRELATWRAMYEETGRVDPLIDLALGWLGVNMPSPRGRPVLVHGDAGPGNFLFDNGHMTALLDWELAHLGDPMEDIAWFSMRCVMEPVPDFAERIQEYERYSGEPIDRARVLYHRVFVSTRVMIIRHRNVTGLPGNSIVSRALNRRLAVLAMAEATGVALPPVQPVTAPATPRSQLYDGVIDDLHDKIALRSEDDAVVAAVKNAAKVLKYLKACDRFGRAVEQVEHAALVEILDNEPPSSAEGQVELAEAIREERIPFAQALAYFAGNTVRDAQLAADSSGGLASRRFPDLP